MFAKTRLLLLLPLLAALSAFTVYQLPIQKLSASLTTKQVHKGKATTLKANLYYAAGGKMVTHFTYPKEYFLLTNNKGEYKIYDPKANTVEQSQNLAFSTDVTYFGHFLNNRLADMGLRNLGFTLYNTRFENTTTITEWQPQLVNASSALLVELVHENNLPIFIGYKDLKGNYMRKVFFYNYQKIQQVNLPATMTDINYLAPGDSVVSRTQYSNLLVNETAKSDYFNFQIPANAKLK